MSRLFGTNLWSVSLEDGWWGQHEEYLSSIAQKPGFGALQISAAERPSLLTDRELQKIALRRVPQGVQVQKTAIGSLSGFTAQYEVPGAFWREWWLRKNNLFIAITYNCFPQHRGTEDEAVTRMVQSLRPEPAA